MSEQSSGAAQIAAAVDSMRRQSDQVAKAMNEQARAARDMRSAAQEISKQIGLITRANREHSDLSARIYESIVDIRKVTEQNVRGVKDTHRATDGLAANARTLGEIMDRLIDK
jgi:methyl-accepting chemotaxis protein